MSKRFGTVPFISGTTDEGHGPETFGQSERSLNAVYVLLWAQLPASVRGDNEFRHNIVKVVCRSPRLSPRDSTATFDNVMSKFMINNKTDARETDVSLLNVINWYSTGDENGQVV